MSDRKTGNYTNDPRVDKAITWVLTAVAGLIFTWLGTTMRGLSEAVGDLKTEIKVAKVERGGINKLEKRLDDLAELVHQIRDEQQRRTNRVYTLDQVKKGLDKHEKQAAHVGAQNSLGKLDSRLDDLERRSRDRWTRTDMRGLLRDMKRLNPETNIPEVD